MSSIEQATDPQHRADYPADLARAESRLVAARRQANGSTDTSARVGVGLSGGGIRSATFCFGVFQALSKQQGNGAHGELLKRVDYLSTVSGGGYFGSFFGRLFARPQISNVAQVAQALHGTPIPGAKHDSFRFLRDNGRYLAPRGSGDLLALIAVTLRNWAAVQVVLMAVVLTAFVALQYADIRIRGADIAIPDGSFVWSPVVLLMIPVALLWAVPTGWAYWVVGAPLSRQGLLRRSDLFALALLLLGSWNLIDWVPIDWGWPPSLRGGALGYASAGFIVVAAVTTLWSVLVNYSGIVDWSRSVFGTADEAVALTNANRARNRLTRWLKRALMVLAAIAVVAFVDTLGATTYAVFKTDEGFTNVTAAAAGFMATLGGFAAFGRQLLVLLVGEGKKGKPFVSLSIITWVAAVVIIGCWLTALSAVAHAVAWAGDKPPYAEELFAAPVTKVMDSEAIAITTEDGRQVLRSLDADPQTPAAASQASADETRDGRFTGRILVLLILTVIAIGKTRTFLNASSLHTFYSQRLTRAYLGASNIERLTDKAHVTDVIAGDDLPSNVYWHWPSLPKSPSLVQRMRDAAGTFTNWVMRRKPDEKGEEAEGVLAGEPIVRKGGPLHLVNVTINETLDNRTGVQRQDRKGVPMAVGPSGLSVGVRHHLVADAKTGFIAHPTADGYAVFRGEALAADPETLTLGRWVSISGAAFSSAIGARTTVPIALLCTFANVRLGYWWDSGLGKGLKQPWLPVYSGLLAESIARLRGTGQRFWNLSDGGHFDNLGGYELIRRRLPLIVLVDAEADPDFEFPGLSELIRKARLDFGAEIVFLREGQFPKNALGSDAFTSLEGLRRAGKASGEGGGTTLSTAADRRRYSRAHAALAVVKYKDDSRGWLVYVKASVSGDEPTDVLQYHAKHPDFPHEPTTDQFFDEAQWESYRRLGEHIGDKVLTSAVLDLASVAVSVSGV